jgi:hypothetical protein
MNALVRSAIHGLRVLALLVGLFAVAMPAAAQGTSGQLPDPLSTVELKRLLTLYVHPTDAEVATIENLHDDYRSEFRAFRDSDIEKFLGEMQKLMGTGMPSKAAVQDFTRKYERINTRIAEIDDRFFDSIATLLGDTRQAAVKRARDARARTRISMGMLGQMPGAIGGKLPDLAALAMESKLPESVLKELEPELIAYEDQLTSAARSMSTAGTRMILEMIESLEKAGFSEVSQEEMMKDPERMKALMENVQTAMAAAMKPIVEKANAVYDLNRRTFHSVVGHLSGKDARRYRLAYVRMSYPEIGNDPANTERMLTMALRIKGLPDADREKIQAEYESWMRADDALTDDAMKLSDEARNDMSNLMGFGAAMGGQQKVMEIVNKRADLGQRTLENVKPHLGEERMKKLYERAIAAADDIFEDSSDPTAEVAADPNAEPPSVGVRAAEMEAAADATYFYGSVRRLAIEDVRSLATELGLDEGSRAAVEMMHADYEKKWESTIDPLLAGIQEAQSSMWRFEDGKTRADSAAGDKYFDLRKERLTKAIALDEALFHDVEGLVDEGKRTLVASARLGRLIDLSGGSDQQMWFGRDEVEQTVNVVSVVRSADISLEERVRLLEKVGKAADEVSQKIRDGGFARLDSERDMNRISLRTQEVYAKAGESGDAANVDMAEAQKVGQEMMNLQAQQSSKATERARLVRTLWEALIEAADAGSRDRLQLAYDSAAYPSIFADPKCASPFIERALTLDDLSADQRRELQALSDQYRTEYYKFCREMIPKGGVAPPPGADANANQEYWRQRMARENQRNKVQFERDERSQRAVTQLRRVLSAEQANRVGGLGAYESQPDGGHGAQVILE